MSDFKHLTPENINMFAIKHYDNPSCVDEQEFLDDMTNSPTFCVKHYENNIIIMMDIANSSQISISRGYMPKFKSLMCKLCVFSGICLAM